MEIVNQVQKMVDLIEDLKGTRDSHLDEISSLKEQLVDKYSTETHVLVERDYIKSLKNHMEDMSYELSTINDAFYEASESANEILSQTEYHEADSLQNQADDWASELVQLLDTTPKATVLTEKLEQASKKLPPVRNKSVESDDEVE